MSRDATPANIVFISFYRWDIPHPRTCIYLQLPAPLAQKKFNGRKVLLVHMGMLVELVACKRSEMNLGVVGVSCQSRADSGGRG